MSALRTIVDTVRQSMPNRSDWLWFWAVISIWCFLIVVAVVPATYWLDVERLEIADAYVGESPKIEYRRTIHRPFSGQWMTTVLKLRPDGLYNTVCTGRGHDDYDPSNAPPDDIDLEWWMGRKCNLSPGTYFIRTTWWISPAVMPRKRLSLVSGPFEIRRRPR